MDVTFNIKATMNERWVTQFCSMLSEMQLYGTLGHSGTIGFYSDGDGDFRPKFEIDRNYRRVDGIRKNDRYEGSEMPRVEVLFDAG